MQTHNLILSIKTNVPVAVVERGLRETIDAPILLDALILADYKPGDEDWEMPEVGMVWLSPFIPANRGLRLSRGDSGLARSMGLVKEDLISLTRTPEAAWLVRRFA